MISESLVLFLLPRSKSFLQTFLLINVYPIVFWKRGLELFLGLKETTVVKYSNFNAHRKQYSQT